MTRTLLATTLAATLASTTLGQSRQVPGPPQPRAVVIEGATIHTVSGDVIVDGYVTFDDGVITAVGAGSAPADLAADADRIDASGLHVYPGLIAPDTHVGLSETGSVSETQDYRELGDIKPEVRAAVAVNPDSDLIPVTRANGILTAMLLPSGGSISGRASVIRLDGWTWEDMTIVGDAGLVVSWPRTDVVRAPWMRRSSSQQRGSAADRIKRIDDVFDAAEHYVKLKDNDPAQRTDMRYEAMRSALAGETPVFVRASSASQIESAVAWGARRGLDVIIVGGDRADEALPVLAKHDIPVIVGGTHRTPRRRDDHYDQPFSLPAKLHEAGIRFAIASGQEPAHERSLCHVAATAAAYGLPKEMALHALTLGAADILGVADRLGSIEVGKQATLIVTTGDPLEITTDTLLAWIDGRRVDLGSRHKALNAKYREKYRQLGMGEE